MPATAYNEKITRRGDAARAILGEPAYKAAAIDAGTPEAILLEISQKEKEGKAADQLQRTRQAEAAQRQKTLNKDLQAIEREYTAFRRHRSTRRGGFTAKEQAPLLAVLDADYATYVEVQRKGKDGKLTTIRKPSEAAADRLKEIYDAVAAVLGQEPLVAAFSEVNYGKPSLEALKNKAETLRVEAQAINKLRAEAAEATKREHEAVKAVNEKWKLYGPNLRAAGAKVAAIRGLLKDA